ncbi:hypothetical protein CWI75_06530 [Kineobactrum sediminis]|uniref:Uncharacterized protein n=1 Tax=Kineobactrum sediminis TaxID=1905677 RepID=A0A2N5Y3V1_9GAMM|nr:hypothetical protein [Kineobactrum sediminis]PLW83074.1 hypothetical protein CWI75_06530 [Kineobactrum sediminis]
MDHAIDSKASPAGFHTGIVALAHTGAAILLLSLFAAADSWYILTGLAVAALLSVITGAFVGLAVSTLIHEWFHFIGARVVRGRYHRVRKIRLFAFDWDFKANSRAQFLAMSYAGTLGSIIAIMLLLAVIPADAPGRIALLAATFGGLAFAGAIEWPVLARVHAGGEPLAELSRITLRILLASAAIGLLVLLTVASLLHA